ncbi:MAG: TolC family protein [Myxococcota bacterium]
MNRVFPSSVVLSLSLSACLPHGRTETPEPAITFPDRFAEPETLEEARDTGDDRWWLRYDDPALHALVESALQRNVSLRNGYAAIEQARALEDQARAARFPTFAAQGRLGFNRSITAFGSGETWSVTGSLPVSYEVDLFARAKSAARAATESVIASELDAAALAISTSAQVAEAWYSVVEARARKKLLAEQHRINETYLELVRLRFEQGLASVLDVHQQRQLTAASGASLELVDGELEVLRQQLAVLLGTPASELGTLPERDEFPELGASPSPGIPASAVWARPDVRAAQQRVRSLDWQVGSAIASRLPTVTLDVTPSYLWQRADFSFGGMASQPTTTTGWTVNAGATLNVPLFDGFAGRGRVDQQRAALQQQVEALSTTVLNALLEVESAIVQERQQTRNVELLAQQAEIAGEALTSARDRYRTGLSDFLPVLTSLQSQQGTQLQVLAARRQQISSRIQLHRALGGAWAERLDAPEPTELIEGDEG